MCSNSVPKLQRLSVGLLQQIIHEELHIKRRDLATEIEVVAANGDLSLSLRNQIDAVRHVGNFAAHPLKSQNTGEIFDVEPGEAEWNLDTVMGLLTHLFVDTAIQAERLARLNSKLTEAGKPTVRQFGDGAVPSDTLE